MAIGSETPAFTFTLNSFRITETRSLHRDTVYVSMAVAVGKNPPISLPAKSMGNLNNGTFPVNLSIPNVPVPPAEKVVFSYTIINSGHDKDATEQTLQKVASAAASKAASAAGDAVGGIAGGPVGSAIGTAAAGWLLGKVEGLIFANCDGVVAAGDHAHTGAELAELTSNSKILTATDENKGTNSPAGCGANSHYFVTWSITGHKSV